ncbi:MAG TPA: hypothetical protein VEY95_06030 [Azospirillaceae bacterium]|nr:hypothetical protein [Azospirillaceae bacterium]
MRSRAALLLSCCTLLAGCLTFGPQAAQPVEVVTGGVEGANCVLQTSAGRSQITTPGVAAVPVSRGELKVTCRKDGFHEEAITVANLWGKGAPPRADEPSLARPNLEPPTPVYGYPDRIEIALRPLPPEAKKPAGSGFWGIFGAGDTPKPATVPAASGARTSKIEVIPTQPKAPPRPAAPAASASAPTAGAGDAPAAKTGGAPGASSGSPTTSATKPPLKLSSAPATSAPKASAPPAAKAAAVQKPKPKAPAAKSGPVGTPAPAAQPAAIPPAAAPTSATPTT